jgi:membrane protein YqaA with SNARE-associated domain
MTVEEWWLRVFVQAIGALPGVALAYYLGYREGRAKE